jgi:hypothetical protein
MNFHDGTTDFLKLLTITLTIVGAVAWLQYYGGFDFAFGIVAMIALIVVFAGGGLFAHANQKMTLDAMTKFNAQDAQIDRYRQEAFKELAKGQTYQVKAGSEIGVIEARRQNKLLEMQEKDEYNAQKAATVDGDTWSWDDESEYTGSGGDAGFQVWS